MTIPKVSVIIPVYNVEKYLEKCIESVRNQSFRDIEIIVVNDGSIDGSRKLLDKFSDERMVIIDKENGGLSSARNAGIEVARGEYLAFVDSDDWIDCEYIEKMYRVCKEKNCDIVQCSYLDVLDDLDDFSKETLDNTPMVYSGKEFSYAMHTLLSWRCNLAWNKLYRKELFSDIRFPLGKIHEDEFTTYKVIWKAEKIGTISDKLYYYRHRNGSIMQRPYSKRRLDASEAYFERAAFYESNGEEELACLTKQRHFDWVLSQKKLLTLVDEEEKAEIISCLESIEEKLKKELNQELFNKSIKRIDGGVFPFSKVEKGSSVILYGGGEIGRHYYRQAFSQDYCNILLWVDKNVENCRRQGIPVVPIERLFSCEENWDYVIIAIENCIIVSDVMKMLMEEYKIPREKIIY